MGPRATFDRQALKTAKTTDYRRTGWTQRNHRAADARIVRVLSFENAFSRLSQDDQAILAATYRDKLDQSTTAALLNCSPCKVNYLLPAAPTFSTASICFRRFPSSGRISLAVE